MRTKLDTKTRALPVRQEEKSLTSFSQELRKIVSQLPDRGYLENRFTELIQSGKFDREKAMQVVTLSLDRVRPDKIQDCFNPCCPTLATYGKYRSKEVARGLIEKMLFDLNDFVPERRKLSGRNIQAIASQVWANYSYLRISDLKLCFQKAMRGDYGNNWTFDGFTVLGWFRKYSEQRQEVAQRLSEQKHKTNIVESKKINSKVAKSMIDSIKAMLERVEKEKKEKIGANTVYHNLRQYCTDNGIDFDKKESELLNQFKAEFSIIETPNFSQEDFLTWKTNAWLVEINKGRS